MIEVCEKCKREFDDDIHFIRCNEDECPMKSGASILDMLLNEDAGRLFDNKPKVSQTFKLNAWIAVPGNEKKTVADYARHLKDTYICQGEMK